MTKKKNNEFHAAWSEKLTYMLVLGFLGILFSFPMITVGASMSAMHSSMKMYVMENDKKVFRNFFVGFKKYFKQSTLIWLVNLVLILLLSFDLMFYGGTNNWIQIMGMTVVTVSLMIVVYEMTMCFVLVPSELVTGVKQTIVHALKFALICPYEALMMLILNLAIPGILILVMVPVLALAPGILSFLTWQFLPKAFEKYRTKCM